MYEYTLVFTYTCTDSRVIEHKNMFWVFEQNSAAALVSIAVLLPCHGVVFSAHIDSSQRCSLKDVLVAEALRVGSKDSLVKK